MSRNERLSTEKEIARYFTASCDPNSGSGPVVRKINDTLLRDTSDLHVEICGNTGMGKTQCVTLPIVEQISRKKESLIVCDSKGEIYKKVGGHYRNYEQFFCLDFSDPWNSPTGWDPLKEIVQLYKSDKPEDHDTADAMMDDLFRCIFPRDINDEAFWTDAAREYAKGLAYGLLETADESEVTLENIVKMMEESEIKMGASTVLRKFYDLLPHGSLAKTNLATYAVGPNETRGSIHSVAATGMETLRRSRGLMEMLKNDTLDILNIDVTQPFVLWIILPQETEAYDRLAGLLVSQVTGHLLRTARIFDNDRLPIRTSIILEELGSVGKSIPDLHKLIAQGRSKNIRLYLILQSTSQLEDVFGKSKAETINSCVGITIGFSSNNWDMMEEWSRRCGEEWVMKDGSLVKDRLVQTSKIAAMPKGRALIMVNNRLKFFSQLPFFYEMYRPCPIDLPPFDRVASHEKPFEFEAMVRNMMLSKGRLCDTESIPSSVPLLFDSEEKDDDPLSVDSLIARIDEKIAQLEAEELAEAEKEKTKEAEEDDKDAQATEETVVDDAVIEKTSEYIITIFAPKPDKPEISKIFSSCMGVSINEADTMLEKFPVITLTDKTAAEMFLADLSKHGYIAMITER